MATQPDLSVTWSQSYKHDTAKHSFLDLPRELRDLIYAHIFHVPGAIYLYSRKVLTRSATTWAIEVIGEAVNVRYRNRGPPAKRAQSMSKTAVSTALLRSCRQVHAEACPVFYSDNVFRVPLLTEKDTYSIALPYRLLVRRVVIHDLYHGGTPDLGEVREVRGEKIGWEFELWPIILVESGKLLDRFPEMESLVVPIKADRTETGWVPTCFKLGGETAEARVELAAKWMLERSPLRNEKLRD